MSETIFIKPAQPGIKVRDPVTKQHLREDGEHKPRSTFWLRRLAAGEVVMVQQAAEKSAAKKG